MVDIPKQQKLTSEVIRAGSPFQLFPLDKTQRRFTDVGKTNIYDRKIFLDTKGMLPLLPLQLYAGATHMSRINALSPYTDDSSEKEIDYATAPLCLDASIHADVLRSMKLTKQSQTLPNPLLPEVKEKLSRFRFQVALPRRETLDLEKPKYIKFVSRPDETSFALGELSFRHFIPQESPRLSKQKSEGYFLMIPSEEIILQKIQGQFIIMPREIT